MADPKTNLRVRISADLAQFKSELSGLQKSIRGIGSVLAGALAGVSVASVVGVVVRATMEAEAATAQLEARLKSTRGAAGLTKDELVNMAGALQGVTTYGDEAILGAQSMLLTFTKIGKEVFPQATESVLNMATAMGTDLNSAAIQLGKALNDPIKGVSALGRAGVQFTAQQKDLIERLVETNRTVEAQKMVLAELETQFGGSARAARNTLGGAFTALKEAAGDLLEGDTEAGGLRGVRNSIEGLTRLLQDPATKESFSRMATGVLELANAFLTLGAQAQQAWAAAQRWVTFKLGGTKQVTDLKQIRYEIGAIGKEIEDLETRSGDRGGWMLEPALADRRKRLRELKRQEEMSLLLFGDPAAKPIATETSRTSTPGKGRWANINGNALPVNVGDPKADERAAKDRDTAAKRAAAEREREAQRLEEEAKARRERIASGLRDVEVALARSAGREADAAWMEIDDRYKQLLEDLKATGNSAGIELVNKLIDVDKADARMAELRRRFDEALQAYQGAIDPALADEALGTMVQVRDAAQQYLGTLSGAAKDRAVAGVKEMGQALDELKPKFSELQMAVADMAQSAVADFFFNLATGAKSFKDSLADAIEGFAKGIARMMADMAAFAVVMKAFDSFMPGFSQFYMSMRGGAAGLFHQGGVVGRSGGIKRNVNPLLFGEAPRYHTGGFAGLKRNEVAAVLEKGEEVLPRTDPRHTLNGGRGGPAVKVEVINNTGASVTQENGVGPSGEHIKRIVIGTVQQGFADGQFDQSLGRFGVRRQGVVRG